jgi:simple sugar transport system substrate-binding protein
MASLYNRAALASILFVGATAEESCPCPDGKTLRIGGVSHGNVADKFWDPVYAAAERAAMDSSVGLDFARYDESSSLTGQGGQDIVDFMVDTIEKMCTGDNTVDGMFSTINDVAVLTALKANCLANGIPTVIINAGGNLAQESGNFLHFIGADDYNTGKDSGEKLLAACPTCQRFYCLDHCGGCTSWTDRCRGFEDAVGEAYGQTIQIDDSSEDAYIASVESVIIGTNGTWGDDVGLLLGTHQSMILFAEALHNKHKKVKLAGVDTSPGLFQVLGDDEWLWGTSQQPYLQGYYPVQMLANTIRMGGQSLQTFNLETGPTFVTEAPEGQALCNSDPFQSCVADDAQKPETVSPLAGDEPSPGARKLASVTTRLVSAALRIFGI